MNNKPHILILTDWYLPGYQAGGPVRSCINLVSALYKDYSFSIATRNTDYQSITPYQNISNNTWIPLQPNHRVYYFSKINFIKIFQFLKYNQFDVIYLNSLFSFYFTIFPLIIINFFSKNGKVILAPRGMLENGALSVKPIKKKIFLSISKILGLFKNIKWHATTTSEYEQIQKYFGENAQIRLAENIPYTPPINLPKRIKMPQKAKFFYLSRISPVKNLLFALAQLKRLEDKNLQIKFDIYGAIDDTSYWNKCQELVHSIKDSNIEINYLGFIQPDALSDTLSSYHYLFLPSLSENYGHAIIESLGIGCPVIISNNTPWKNLEQHHAGWDIHLNDEDKFLKTLIFCVSFGQDEFDKWSNGAHQFALKNINIEQIKHNYSILFND